MQAGIIDIHTHYFPNALMEPTPLEWAAKRHEAHWILLAGPRADGRRSLQGFPSLEKFLRDMDKAGVERAVIQGWYWESPQTCEEFNALLKRAVCNHKDRFSAFASVQPAHIASALKIAQNARRDGFCGLGEIHDGVQKFSYLSGNFAALAALAAKEALPFCLHITEENDRTYVGKVKTDLSAAYAAAARFESANFIFAHWGGGEFLEGKSPSLKNVFYDSSASPLLYKAAVWNDAFCKADDAQLTFGSDYPLRLYPKHNADEEFETIVNEARANVPNAHAQKFFRQNAAKLLML